jgi:hypothetical protein
VAAWPAIWQYNNWPVPSKETSPFLHDFQRGPNLLRGADDPSEFEDEMREYIRSHGHTVDVAWVYTVVAGVLNILVIYDAFAGPALATASAKPDLPRSPEGGPAS